MAARERTIATRIFDEDSCWWWYEGVITLLYIPFRSSLLLPVRSADILYMHLIVGSTAQMGIDLARCECGEGACHFEGQSPLASLLLDFAKAWVYRTCHVSSQLRRRYMSWLWVLASCFQ